MRVIAGTARGKNLQALPGEDITRPTINRVKEAMFSSVQFLVPGARVLDLFAGSGQLGIEALSRGAKSCLFVDHSAEALAIVRANCKTAALTARVISARARPRVSLPTSAGRLTWPCWIRRSTMTRWRRCCRCWPPRWPRVVWSSARRSVRPTCLSRQVA